MLLAIDAGNTHLVFGLWNGSDWQSVWRMKTDPGATEDQIATFFLGLATGLPKPREVICANVVPALADSLRLFGQKWLGVEVWMLTAESLPDLEICYRPRSAVGADRLANALAAKAKYKLPAIIVDFGTATTFDAIGAAGEYLGGSILPGPLVAMEALFSRAAKLPKVELAPPKRAIGADTTESLQSGLVLGYAGAIDALVDKMRAELGGSCSVISTGGLGELYAPLCEKIEEFDPFLTLDGLRIAART